MTPRDIEELKQNLEINTKATVKQNEFLVEEKARVDNLLREIKTTIKDYNVRIDTLRHQVAGM